MIKIFLFSLFLFVSFKILRAFLKVFKFQKTINKKNDKVIFKKKLSKMDIQDAEFEEN